LNSSALVSSGTGGYEVQAIADRNRSSSLQQLPRQRVRGCHAWPRPGFATWSTSLIRQLTVHEISGCQVEQERQP